MEQQWWNEVVANEVEAEDIEAKEALRFLIDRLGSQSKAAKFLGVDQRLVNRNVQGMDEGKRLTKRMRESIQKRLQVIPRRRSDNPIERMAWLVQHLDHEANVQKRATIEVRDRLAALERERQGPAATWYAEMDAAKRYLEKVGREMGNETRRTKEEREQYKADMEQVMALVLQVYDMISRAVNRQGSQEVGVRNGVTPETVETQRRLQALTQSPEFQRDRRKLQEYLAEQAKNRTQGLSRGENSS